MDVDSTSAAGMIDVRVDDHGSDACVVTVTGEVDTLTAPTLASVLRTQLVAAQLVVVDLDGVGFLGSAGLAALFEAHVLATQENCVLRLVCHSRIANRALEVTKLRDSFIFADTVRAALNNDQPQA